MMQLNLMSHAVDENENDGVHVLDEDLDEDIIMK